MNSFQDNGGTGVFILESGACAAETPVKTFTWPATERRICFFSTSYRQVKGLPATATTWSSSTDKLAGTAVYGTEGSILAGWGIDYSTMSHETFLFTTLNMQHFLIASKAILDVTGGPVAFEVIQSSLSQSPSRITMFNRPT